MNQNRRGTLRRFKWGLIFAGVYVLTGLTCYLIYRGHRIEYSIPMFILYYSSFPVFVLVAAVRNPFSSLRYSEWLYITLILFLTGVIYFGIGQVVGYLVKSIARRVGKANQLLADAPVSSKQDDSRP